MTRFTHRQSRSVGHGRRLTEWTATVPEVAFVALPPATAVLDSVFTAGDPETIIRVRGLLSIQSDQIVISEQPFGAVGLAVVTDQAVAIGVTAIPTPYADGESDKWLLHEYWAASMEVATAVSIANISQRFVLDSKAMRKVSPDETVVLVIENGSAGGGAIYRLDLRILSKLA